MLKIWALVFIFSQSVFADIKKDKYREGMLTISCYFSGTDRSGEEEWYLYDPQSFNYGSSFLDYVGPYKITASLDESYFHLEGYLEDSPIFKIEYNDFELRTLPIATRFIQRTSLFHEEFHGKVQLNFFCGID